MVLFNFNIPRYYETNQFLMAAVEYHRKSNAINKKQIQKEANISHATYRRAEITNFVDHPEILIKIANYFGISTTYDPQMIREINDDFNLLYTYLYLYDVEKMEHYYQKIENRAKECENNILFSIYHFSRLIYFMGSPMRGELDKISESLSILHNFEENLLDEFIFLLEHYQFCYYSLIHDKANTICFAKQVYLDAMKYPKLFPYILYQISLNYYFINDYANSIFYSLEALPKLEEDLNYNRAEYCRLNIAICFERLNNTVKSKEIINRIFLRLMMVENPRIEYLAKLTLANCYVSEEDYIDAVKLFEELELNRTIRGENSLMILYCYYQLNQVDSFKKLKTEIDEAFKKWLFYSGYYDAVLLLDALITNHKKILLSTFKQVEKSFSMYGDSKIVDLIYKEMRQKKVISNNS
ncbi:MAG: hypothetical protein WCT17_04115 [Bacilli bacterium]